MISNEEYNPEKIFRSSSTTYFNSSLFFSPSIRKSIAKLYAFVRVADNFVDAKPQDENGFLNFETEYYQALQSGSSENPVIQNFIELQTMYNFDKRWTEYFFKSMRSDLTKNRYLTVLEVEDYIYGSAVVIGFYLCKILGIPEEAYPNAQKLAQAMQYINMIRDVKEDLLLDRIYLPQSVIRNFQIKEFSLDAIQTTYSKEFHDLIRNEIDRYFVWQKEGEKGYHFIPRLNRIPVKTAADLYKWTARKIYENPLIVLEKKVKPSKIRVIIKGMVNSMFV